MKGLYRKLTRNHCVSLVSSREIDFLGLAESVRPTLFIDRENTLEALECSFLKPESSLYAYGPIASDVTSWQGAPSLRVAACLGPWAFGLGDWSPESSAQRRKPRTQSLKLKPKKTDPKD